MDATPSRTGATPAGDVLANAAARWSELAQRIPGAPPRWSKAFSVAALAHHTVAGATAGSWRIALAGPASVVVKRIAPAAGGSPHWRAATDPADPFFWEREALAYESGFFGDRRTGIRAADCYLVDRRDDAVDLYLEDVRGRPGTRWDVADYARAAEQLGRFHAIAPPPADGAAWPRGLTFFEAYAARREHLYANAEEIVRAPATALDGEALRELGAPIRRLWEQRDRIFRFCAELPPVRCHNDFWSPNLFAAPPAGANEPESETVAIDLAYAGIGPPGHDAANLVVDAVMDFFVPAGDAQALWDAVAAAYRRGLATGLPADVVRASERVMEMTAALKFAWLVPATFQAARDAQARERLAHRHGDADAFFRRRAAALRFAGGYVEHTLAKLHAGG
jgi:hypothetical protein